MESSTRPDTMKDQLQLKQVEINTYSAAGFLHAQNVTMLHRYVDIPVSDQSARHPNCIVIAPIFYTRDFLS